MAVTLLFVHGTGVRHEGYERNLEAIRAGCKRAGLDDINVVGCPWGETVGVSTDLIDNTLPPNATRAALDGPPTPEDELAGQWEVLLEDPLFELGLAGEAAAAEGGFAIGALTPGQELAATLRTLAVKPDEIDLEGTGIGLDELRVAATEVANSPELIGAARAASSDPAASPDELADIVARAVVASVLSPYLLAPPGEGPVVFYNTTRRDALVEGVAALLAPDSTRGLGSWLGEKLLNFAARRATSAFAARRNRVTVGSLPFLGDILYYQKRGDPIRKLVAEAIAAASAPVVALGHSLGGIVLVDLLTGPDPPQVERLVTVGSQSPLFYAIDSLDRVRRLPAGAQPPPFTPWLNIYDRSDFLSFVAEEVFTGRKDISDREIFSGVPFPASHSAYFHQPETFELIAKFLPA